MFYYALPMFRCLNVLLIYSRAAIANTDMQGISRRIRWQVSLDDLMIEILKWGCRILEKGFF